MGSIHELNAAAWSSGLAGPADRRIAAIMRHQYGVASLEQLVAAGLTVAQVIHRQQTGQLEAFRHGVWKLAGVPSQWEQAALAAVLGGGHDTVLSHGAAARLWGVPRFEHATVEVTEPRPRSSRLDQVRCHRSVVVDVDRRTRMNIPVTSAERMVVDLSSRLTVAELGKTVDDALRRGVMHLDALADCVARLRPARGRSLRSVHAVLGERLNGYHPGDSHFEVRVARVLSACPDIPPLVHQYPVVVGGRRYLIDLANPTLLVAHECDGWEFHRTRSAFSNDRVKANDLASVGWTVLRYTPDMTDAEIARYARHTITCLRSRSA